MQSRKHIIRLSAFLPMILLLGVFVCATSFAAEVSAQSGSVAIVNVRIFDGKDLADMRTVVIENGLISSASTAETIVDGQGGTLMPGLIDSHIHLDSRHDLEQAARWGVTTMLDMGTPSMALVNNLRHLPGLPANVPYAPDMELFNPGSAVELDFADNAPVVLFQT